MELYPLCSFFSDALNRWACSICVKLVGLFELCLYIDVDYQRILTVVIRTATHVIIPTVLGICQTSRPSKHIFTLTQEMCITQRKCV